MMQRCSNPKNTRWDRYGGRGITVCLEWQQFIPFMEWSKSNGYQSGLQIDRRENNGNYEPRNCRWFTRIQNIRNSTVATLTEDSVKQIRQLLSEGFNQPQLAEKFGVSQVMISRIHLGKNWKGI